MNVSLVNAAAAMNANARWQEVISENLSASSVPGFRRQQMSFSAVEAGVMRNDPSLQHWSLPKATNTTSFQRGELYRSDNPLHVGIEGPGFFEVQMPDGTLGYTRDGSFQMNAQGQLVTKLGYPVIGSNGPIQFDRNSPAPISISPTGEVAQGGESKGELKLVDFNQPQQLMPVTGGYFITGTSGLMPEELRTPAVRQGFLEGANTSSVAEMANLITAMRGFETNQRIVQLNDERMGRAISELGNPN